MTTFIAINSDKNLNMTTSIKINFISWLLFQFQFPSEIIEIENDHIEIGLSPDLDRLHSPISANFSLLIKPAS
jgi:hypothetical protein